MKKKLLALLLSFVMALGIFAFVACDDEPDKKPKPTDSVTLTLSKTLSVKEEESKQITVTYNGTGTLTYTVDKTDVATVEKDSSDQKKATVTGVKEGTATLTVTDGTLTETCAVTVTKKSETENPEIVTVKNGDDEISKLYIKADGAAVPLTAEASNGSTIESWTSSDPTVATVANGVVSPVKLGYTVITAKVSDTVKAEIPVWVTPEDYTLENGANSAEMPNDRWIEWHDQDWWCNAEVTLSEYKFADNAATVTYTAKGGAPNTDYPDGGCPFGVQFFYNYSTHDDRTAHEVTLTICSHIALTAVVNGESVELEADVPKTVSVEYVEGVNRINNQTASISIQIPVAEGNDISNTVSVGDVIMKDLPQTALTTPADFDIGENNTVTFTADEEEADLIGGYEIAVYSDGNLVTVLDAANGEALNLNSIESGDYVLKIRAYAGNDYATDYVNSAWSEGVDLNWNNNSAPAIEHQGSDANEQFARTHENEWALFSIAEIKEGTSTRGNALETIIVVDYAGGGKFWITQLFRKITEWGGAPIDSTKKYRISLQITADFSGEVESAIIQVNGENVTLQDGVMSDPITHTWDAGADMLICIAFGDPTQPNEGVAYPGRYEIRNITLVEISEAAD